MRLSYDPISRSCRLLFCITLILIWSNPTRWSTIARGDETAPPTTTDITPQQLSDVADQLDKMLQNLQDADKSISHETFEVRPIVVKLNADPQKILDWVKTQTRFVPYQGVLRGPIGVLMDRSGNSLDRSLLLAEMLRYTGATYRLAHITLSPDQAEKSFAANKPDAAPNTSDSDQDKELQDYAKSHNLDPTQFHRDIDKLTLPFEQMGESVGQSVSDQLPTLRAAITAPPSPQTTQHNLVLQALADHWWVQLRDADNKWIDLDPMSDQIGPLSPQSTLDPNRVSGLFPLDPSLYHVIRIRVITEQWKDGKLKQTPVLDQPLKTADLAGREISFCNAPMNWPGDLKLLGDSDPNSHLRAAILAQQEWVPALTIGTNQFTHFGFFDTGEIDPQPPLDSLGKTGGSVAKSANAVLQAFGDDKPAAPTTFLTAEWVEFEITSPQAPLRTERRQIFDLIGSDARAQSPVANPQITDKIRLDRGTALLENSKMLATGCRLSPEFIQHQAIANALSNRDAMLKLLRNGGNNLKDANDLLARISIFPAPLYEWQVARFAWSAHSDDLYLGQTNLVALRQQSRIDDQGQLTCRQVFDIVANSLDVLPENTDPFAVRVEQGVVDTNVESAIMQRESIPSPISTAALYTRSAAQGIKWTTIHPGADASAWNDIKIPADIRTKIDRDLAAGYVVIVPQKGIEMSGATSYGWWHIDPNTGETLGMTDQGGAVMGEYAYALAGVLSGFTFIMTLWGCGGLDKDASTTKMIGCSVCAAVAAAVVALAVLAAPGAGAGAALKGAAVVVASQGGTAGLAGITGICAAVSKMK